MKKSLARLKNWLQWHGYLGATTVLHNFVEHFCLSAKEEALLKDCVHLHLLKEYVCHSEDRSRAYLVVKVHDCMRLLKMWRKNMKCECK